MGTRVARVVVSVAVAVSLGHGSHAEGSALDREYIDPATGYTQAVAVTTGGVKTIHISGQIGDGEGLEAQLRAAYTSLGKRLEAAGAGFEHVVKTTTYIVAYRPADLGVFRAVRKEFMGDRNMPASTLIGVQSLALRSWLVEIEATAVVAVGDR